MRIARWEALVLAVGATVLAVGAARAQGGPVEIGTQAIGIVRLSQGDFSATHIALPGGEVESLPTLYAAIFVSPRLALEPAVAYQNLSAEGSSSWLAAATLRLGGYFQGARQDSPFLFGELGILGADHSDSHAGFGVGGGYRWLTLNGRLALRLEGRARRWTTDPDLTELGIALAGGIVVGRAR